MGSLYSQLSYEDRVHIEVLLRHGAHQAGVARYLGCHRSTVSREVARAASSGFRTYAAEFGHRYRVRGRRRAGLSRRKLGTDFDSPAWQHVREGLAAKRSPQEIAGRLALVCKATGGQHLEHEAYVSHETIYCAIYAMPRGELKAQLISQLTRSRGGRRPRSRAARAPTIADMTPIALRPPEVAARIVPGHWEGDLIKGAGNLSAVGTLVERTSRYIMLVKLDGLGSQAVIEAFAKRLREIPPSLRKTLTYDQGSEMALHKVLASKLRIDIYFCDAHSPWQRGSNESANGIVREFLPKGIDLAPFTDQDLRNIEYVMNNTPRKILGYYTPAEVFSRLKIDDISGVALQP
jgi:IS30 family transposase